MWQDFDHSVPGWRVILPLGFPGMKKRLEKYVVAGDPFYEGLKIAMDAMLAGIDRFIEQGKKNLGGTRSSASAVAQERDPPVISAATFSSFSLVLPISTTFAPFRARSLAIALQSVPPAPVTTATLSLQNSLIALSPSIRFDGIDYTKNRRPSA
jgi:hypothetical protein